MCYQQHGHCSEEFYQDQVKETLQSTVADEQTRQATLDMLQRLQLEEEEAEDDELEEEKVRRIQCIYDRLVDGEDPDRVWLDLHEDERQEFWQIIESGQLAEIAVGERNLVPWYSDPISNGLIQELSTTKVQSDRIPAAIPDGIPSIQSLLGGRDPSPQLCHNLAERSEERRVGKEC